VLQKPKDLRGYTKQEILEICKERKIHIRKFWKAFGVNTVLLAEDNTARYYVCDVEAALYELKNKDGKFHLWD